MKIEKIGTETHIICESDSEICLVTLGLYDWINESCEYGDEKGRWGEANKMANMLDEYCSKENIDYGSC